ncbi:hypothetical protein [Roseimaritima sediminicola]|uniref:hypothetical protein n=1 Tax=Roseimaritima sediminicola TaxID=2662066 RepID=UPI0028F451EC|nr:hypothetical protein [Roseimaritima sediminicola]
MESLIAARIRLKWLWVRLWAGPYTLLGLTLGVLLGGRMQVVDGVIEIHGPRIAALLRRLPPRAIALTLGHTVLAQSEGVLSQTRVHERVHVRQFQRWGPLMGPAYLLASLYLYARGRDYYRDNPFEVEAFASERAPHCEAGMPPTRRTDKDGVDEGS